MVSIPSVTIRPMQGMAVFTSQQSPQPQNRKAKAPKPVNRQTQALTGPKLHPNQGYDPAQLAAVPGLNGIWVEQALGQHTSGMCGTGFRAQCRLLNSV